jgi:hypothetical protein
MGIPVGPDTSLVLAEVVAARIDQRLMEQGLIGLRFIDDYEVGCETRHDAEAALERIERTLAEYELAINPKKTRIEELPCELKPHWIRELSEFRFRNEARVSRSDAIKFFDTAFRLHREVPTESVIAYATSRLASVEFLPDVWSIVRPLLCQCLLVDPASIRSIHRILIRHSEEARGSDVDRTLNSLIGAHSHLDHGSEVAWAIWTCIRLSIPIHEPVLLSLAQSSDSIVRILALLARERGLLEGSISLESWEQQLSENSLYDEHWLFAYEANVRGWFGTSHDDVKADANFSELKSSGVSFILAFRGFSAVAA